MKQVDEETLQPKFILPLQRCNFGELGACYVVFEKERFPLASFNNMLSFTMKEVDDQGDSDDGYDDEYELEDIELCIGNYVQPLYSDYGTLWSELAEFEVVETYSLSAVSTLSGSN